MLQGFERKSTTDLPLRSFTRAEAKVTCCRLKRRVRVLNSIRARITFWYVSVFGLLLLAFSCFIYLTLPRSLYHRLDESLIDDAQVATESLETETEENRGDARAGASESLSELQLRNAYVAIFSGDTLLAANYPDDS